MSGAPASSPEIWQQRKAAGPDASAYMAVEKGVLDLRRTLALIFTFTVFCAYAPPTVIAMQMAVDPDVGFWVGRLAWGTLCVPILLIAQHMVHETYLADPRLLKAMMFTVALIPAIWFCVVGGLYMNEADYVSGEMRVSDCGGMDAKANLQEAYGEATTLKNTCLQRKIKENANQPIHYDITLPMCDEYKWALGNGTSSYYFRYLAHCEINHQCSGFCDNTHGDGLFVSNFMGKALAPCDQVIGLKLLVVKEQALILLIYGVLMIAAVFSTYLLVTPICRQLGYMSFDSPRGASPPGA